MRTLGWVAFLVAVGFGLWLVPTPVSNVSLDGISESFASARPDEVAVVLVRLVAGLWLLRAAAVTAYLLVATLVEAPEHIDNALARLPAIGRRLVRPIAVGVVFSSLATSTSAIAQEVADTPEPTTSVPSEPTPTSSASPVLVMTRLPDTGWPNYYYPTTVSDLDEAAAALEAVDAAVVVGDSWTVERGDHLWSIAQRTAPANASLTEVGQRWLAIIELNRSALPDPDNPDLIYPGAEVRLPPTYES